jgi:putative restriction endonuclease
MKDRREVARVVLEENNTVAGQRIDNSAAERNPKVREELERRKNMWNDLLDRGGPREVPPTILRALGIYGGAQGVWVDKTRTNNLTDDGTGVTVGLLHTGVAYADDLSEDGVLYHYPDTNRIKGRDLSEIDATKAAGIFGVPVFVITHSQPDSTKRDVHLGWIEGWDDALKLFLVTFDATEPLQAAKEPEEQPEPDEEPFDLVARKRSAKREVQSRLGQQRFKFRVFKRYSLRCAVCDISIAEVLDAAHLRPRREYGSDDPRNGLVLCALHHRALDAGLFAIEPDSLKIHFREFGPDATALNIEHPTLGHLAMKPHRDALEWLWNRWQR